ncbi:transglutaminase domain-containing protein [Faecalicatena contorta]|uniref:transglutaminase domain-containing protein n=1 Tax=Faecalicatena contorta TaxID=39482 RepID=UPI001F27E8AC|nr:hypothetical protein [Faecalicatena contorta]MCF2681548.1 hypothetical protein [Faecalicatena contorta]
MKRLLSVISYIFISIALFFSGVMLEVSPSDLVRQVVQDQIDIDDQDQADDSKDASDDKDDAVVQDEADNQINTRYYYSLMDDSEKENYDRIQEAVAGEENSVVLDVMDQEELKRIFLSVYYDYPEYFWLEYYYSYKSTDEGMELIFNYNCTGSEREKREAEIEQQAGAILAGLPAGAGDYDKVKYVFETLVDMTKYELDAPDNQNIYSVFGNWTTVCAGYAKATKYLLDRAGVECFYVTGLADGEPHAWNIVQCDGQYYYVDTTWGDPLYQETQGEEMQKKGTAYEYLCCTGELLFRTHTPDEEFTLPECTDNSLEYYRMAGRYLESADQNAILEIMKKDIDNDEKQTEIQFSGGDALDQAVAQIDSTLQQVREYSKSKKGKSLGELWYTYRDNTSILIVYWE